MSIDKKFILWIILTTILTVVISFIIGIIIGFYFQTKNLPSDSKKVGIPKYFYEQPMIPFYAETYVLGTYVLGTLVDKELYNIIDCESQFDPTVCNKDYGCGSGIGLGQLTKVAMEDCEKGLNKKIDPFNPQENLECSIWLYEKYGTKPWGCEECEWGSWKCWNQKV